MLPFAPPSRPIADVLKPKQPAQVTSQCASAYDNLQTFVVDAKLDMKQVRPAMSEPPITIPADGRSWAMSNAQPADLFVWLEPWAEEFCVPSKSSILFDIDDSTARAELPEIELTDDHVVFWANFGSLVRVKIDDILQDSASAKIIFPDIPNLSPKDFLNLVFPEDSAARVGGRTPATSPSRSTWRKLTDWFGR